LRFLLCRVTTTFANILETKNPRLFELKRLEYLSLDVSRFAGAGQNFTCYSCPGLSLLVYLLPHHDAEVKEIDERIRKEYIERYPKKERD